MLVKKTLESPLDSKEIKPDNPKGNQPWILRTAAEAKASILWQPGDKSWLTGKDWCWERLKAGEGDAEDKTVGWHHQLNGHEFEQTLGDGEWHGSLVCCSPWGRKESNTTEQLNNKWCIENITIIEGASTGRKRHSKINILKKLLHAIKLKLRSLQAISIIPYFEFTENTDTLLYFFYIENYNKTENENFFKNPRNYFSKVTFGNYIFSTYIFGK